MPDAIRAVAGGVRIDVRVTPRAARSTVDGMREGRLVVRVTAPPVDRAANDAVVEIVAAFFGVPRRSVRIAGGERGRNKTIQIDGLSPEDAARRLGTG